MTSIHTLFFEQGPPNSRRGQIPFMCFLAATLVACKVKFGVPS